MRRSALLLPLAAITAVAAVAACAPMGPVERAGAGAGEPVATSQQRFTSNEAVLLDFEMDGKIFADTDEPAALRTLIGAQLMYSVGQLNGERSVGRHERLELSAVTATASPTGDGYEVTYHAKLPVAWGRDPLGTAPPTAYELALPRRAASSDQSAFASKYGATCSHPDAGSGPMHPARMFLFYRPQNAECQLAAEDVVRLPAKVSPSSSNTNGKYPEYDRMWDEGELSAVAIFSRAEAVEKTGDDDEGVRAQKAFVERARDYLGGLGITAPVATTKDGSSPATSLRVTLTDGRKIAIHSRLVGHELAKDGAAFDGWYDALTPEADLILYSGHAGLGENVRTLMKKGTFRAGKYVIWMVNGCDTFAYVDRTLADRRALLNPDDVSGTKYMDVVSNVLAGYFNTGPDTSMTLIDAVVAARNPNEAPRTYREIFQRIDPSQVVAVTGEEDNAAPKPASNAGVAPAGTAPGAMDPPPANVVPDDERAASASGGDDRAGCSTAPARASRRGGGVVGAGVTAALAALVLAIRRRRRYPRPE